MKKFLICLVFLISFLFIVNVKADSSVVTTMLTPMQNYINNHSGATQQDYIDYLLSYNDILQEDTNYNYYTIIFNGTWLYYFKLNNPFHIATNDSGGHAIWLYPISNSDVYGYEQYEIVSNSRGEITNFRLASINNNLTGPATALGYSGYLEYYILATNQENYEYTSPSWSNTPFSVDNTTYTFGSNVPVNFTNGTIYTFEVNDFLGGPSEPTYEYEETILDNGNVRLDFTFTNYNEGTNYAFEIENGVSNEQYGVTNPFSNIYRNIIPYGNSYSIELAYDTFLYVTLAQFTQVEDTTLYWREEIYTNMIDINNIVFNDDSSPYFTIYQNTKNTLKGSFANIKNNNTCWYQWDNGANPIQVYCDQILTLTHAHNGYIKIFIKKNNDIVYSRNINILGGNFRIPYIVYEVTQQDFYSVVTWYIDNIRTGYENLSYRYSTNGGTNFSEWENYNKNNTYTINAFDNSLVIIEIADENQETIYDAKSIQVVNNIETINTINSGTSGILNKFKSLFSVNSNILYSLNAYYSSIKNSKIYLLVFIPFLTTIICAIIYLIRRK